MMTVVRASRVAGIAFYQGRVLLHRSEFDDFWTLPGGSIEDLERAESALIREMQEELNADVLPGKLLIVVENFFSYNGVNYHETGLYFEMHFPQEHAFLNFNTPFDGVEKYFNNLPPFRLIFEWIPLNHLAEILIKPAFLTEILPELKANPSTCHVVHDDSALSR